MYDQSSFNKYWILCQYKHIFNLSIDKDAATTLKKSNIPYTDIRVDWEECQWQKVYTSLIALCAALRVVNIFSALLLLPAIACTKEINTTAIHIIDVKHV